MLTDGDVEWIRSNRADIKQHRTELITVIHVDGTEEAAVEVVFKEPRNPSGEPAREIDGYFTNPNDYNVSFDADFSANTALTLIRGGRQYVLTDVDERGLGGLNRYECRAMLVVAGTQSITVKHGGDEDGWGAPTPETPDTVLVAYVSEEDNILKNSYGEEAVVQLRVIIAGLAPITYRDKVRYENEAGLTIEREPVRISVKRRADGTPLVTEVYV